MSEMAMLRQPLGAGSNRAILAWLSEEIGLDSLYEPLVFLEWHQIR